MQHGSDDHERRFFGAGSIQSLESLGISLKDDGTLLLDSARLKAKFAEDKHVSAMRIQVETLKGEVQLSGFAASQAEKERAGQIARSVDNVTRVRNNIVVRSGSN